jgi:hypothetical protein
MHIVQRWKLTNLMGSDLKNKVRLLEVFGQLEEVFNVIITINRDKANWENGRGAAFEKSLLPKL